jgi:hypothetical protein
MNKDADRKRTTAERASTHEVRIWIDDYNDIFSDFDPRHYSERNISDDFLHEVKKVVGESDFDVRTLYLLIDEKMRDQETEVVISTRVHNEFSEMYSEYHAKRRMYRSRSVVFLVTGLLMILGASYFSYLKADHPLMHIPVVILEPAGWFLTWTAFEQIFRSGKNSMPEFVFYKKLNKTKIVFGNI